ncbi:hypothetical protein [Pengzhenrongella sp.]|uniref:hypothetical protein n=1 Tax=Pengzhenrongella sp. TaxID=2888820 RepID=UPI002F94FE30
MPLSSQCASLHDTPCSSDDYDAFLSAVVVSALAMQGVDGNLELDAAGEDVGDTSLGVTSLLLLAATRGTRTPGANEAAERSLRFFLRERVFRTDNPGYPNLRRRGAGEPYARYVLADGAHPFGDWPSTVWAMLHAVNVLALGAGQVAPALLDELLDVTRGYWRWLTEITFFNPQDTANQALGAVVAALLLADELDRRGVRTGAEATRTSAYEHYALVRAQRLPDRGHRLPAEHGGAWDGNYGPVSLSFLAQAHRVTADPVFLEDGCDLATYLDARTGARGFDVGGSRYVEQHPGFEATLGLRYFGRRIGADLGRYLGNDRHRYLMDAAGAGDGTASPDGHFAFMALWAAQDTTPWWTTPHEANRRHQLRRGDVSVGFDDALRPHLLQVGGVAVLPSVLAGQGGIAPAYRTPTRSHVLARPLAPVRSVELDVGGWSAKLVTTAVATWDEVLLTTRTLYLTDGARLHVVVLLDPAALPPGSGVTLLAGLPYAAPAPDGGYHKVVQLEVPDGTTFDLGNEGARLRSADGVVTAGLAIRGNGDLRVTNPVPPGGLGSHVLSSSVTRDQTLEQVAFGLADDPHGYGNPERALERLLHTNLLEVLAGRLVGRDLALVASYAPVALDAAMPDVVAAAAAGDVRVIVPGLEVIVGPAAGDEHGNPVLRLNPR